MYSAVVDGHIDVISAFSSDGRIAAFDLIVLEDPLSAVPPYDAVLLLSESASSRPAVTAALTPLIDAIDDTMMRSANQKVDLDHRPVSSVAHSLSRDLQN
jgi:osmoprotectant transport system permease protein